MGIQPLKKMTLPMKVFFRVGEPPGTRRSSFISPMSQTAPHSVSETTQLKD